MPEKPSSQFLAGLGSGVTTSLLLNPWDRALYLSFKEHRPFLHSHNFHEPFRGVVAATVSKVFSHGMYFPLYDTFHRSYESENAFHPALSKFLAGNSAGIVNALMTSPISAVKYKMWGQNEEAYVATASKMWQSAGVRPFLRGTYATVVRDTVWGGVFALSLHAMQTDDARFGFLIKFGTSTVAAVVATVVSAPLNYVRNQAFATPLGVKAPRPLAALRAFAGTVRDSPRPFRFTQQQFGIGWGTLRVGVGMALSGELYRFYNARLET